MSSCQLSCHIDQYLVCFVQTPRPFNIVNNLLNGYKFRSGEHNLSSHSFTETMALRHQFKPFLDILEQLVDEEVSNIGGSVSWADYMLFYVSSMNDYSKNRNKEKFESLKFTQSPPKQTWKSSSTTR